MQLAGGGKGAAPAGGCPSSAGCCRRVAGQCTKRRSCTGGGWPSGKLTPVKAAKVWCKKNTRLDIYKIRGRTLQKIHWYILCASKTDEAIEKRNKILSEWHIHRFLEGLFAPLCYRRDAPWCFCTIPLRYPHTASFPSWSWTREQAHSRIWKRQVL